MELFKNVIEKMIDKAIDTAFDAIEELAGKEKKEQVKEAEEGLQHRDELLASTNWMKKKRIFPIVRDKTIYFTSTSINAISLQSIYLHLRYLLENFGYIIEANESPFNLIYKTSLLENRYKFGMFIEGRKKFLPNRYPYKIYVKMDGFFIYSPDKDDEIDIIPIKSRIITTISLMVFRNIQKPEILSEYDMIVDRIIATMKNFGFTE